MIPFPIAFLGILIGTLAPAYLGLFASVSMGGARPQYLAAVAVGVYLWFLSDTLGDSSYLGVNLGLSGGLGHLSLVLLFLAAPIALFVIEGLAPMQASPGKVPLPRSLPIAALVAFALSLHGLGEGMGYGYVASLASNSSIFGTFGGYAPAASYVFHKVLEPVIIGACYSGFARPGGNQGPGFRWKSLVLLGAIFIVPTLIGTAVGYYSPLDTTYFFSLGAGASVYVLLKLAQILFEPSNPFNSPQESLKVVLLVISGFLLIYFAAIFHSVV